MHAIRDVILGEIFNLCYRVSDVAIEYLCDELEKCGCIVSHHDNFDSSVFLYFQRSADETHPVLEGELRVDRIYKRFEISAKYGNETIMPASGDWNLVMEYLQKILSA